MSNTIKSNLQNVSTTDFSTTKRTTSHNAFADELKMAAEKMRSNSIDGTEVVNLTPSNRSYNRTQFRDIDDMVEHFIKEAPLTSYQKMTLSSATAYEKQKLKDAGLNPADVDMYQLFCSIVDTAASIEDTFNGSVNDKVSTLHTLPVAFLAKHSA